MLTLRAWLTIPFLTKVIHLITESYHRLLLLPHSAASPGQRAAGAGAASAAVWNSLATRSAVRRPQAPAVISPTTSTATPQPAISHQPTWLAVTNPVRSGPTITDTTTEPITATPTDYPTCLLVDATAAATPAWATGIPDTAVFVIGAFTRPKPRPNSR